MDLLLGIDAGTTSVKAGLFAADGTCLGVERQEYQLDTPAVEYAQLDPDLYWQACVKTVREVVRRADVHPDQILAVGVSSQGETTITLDESGKPIYPAIVWLDNRAVSQAKNLAAKFNSQVYERTGIPEIIPTWSACKIMWLKENEPKVFNKAYKFLLVQDFLIFRLSGRIVTDGSISCTTLLFDIRKDEWWQIVLSEIGISDTKLPEILLPGACVGKLNGKAAEELGLSERTLVVNGGMDQAVGAIGAGNIQPNIISESTGAALAIQATISGSTLDKSKTTPVYMHSVIGKYLLVPVCPTGGMALKWFRDQFGQKEIHEAKDQNVDSYDLMTKIAESAPPGSDGLVMLPHLMGAFSPDINPLARGAFTGFSLSHTRAHFVRSLLEGVAFLLKRNLENLKRVGINTNEIISTGGGSRSRFWNQIKANVCNLPVVTMRNEETVLLGDAILAGFACGIFKTVKEGCQTMVAIKERILPNEEMHSYIKPYQLYCKLDQTLAEYYKQVYGETQITF